MNNDIIGRDKIFSASSWHFMGQMIMFFSTFLIGIILARLLSPSEFGLVAMATIFIAISHAFVDSGFGQALIQKKECNNIDYSTVFYFNIFISVIAYILIFAFSKLIAEFFKEEQLIKIIRVLGILIIINAFNTVQIAQFKKELNFKIQTIAITISSILSGCLGIYLAYHGYEVWSLVYQSITNQLLTTILFWSLSKWRPEFVFSLKSLKPLFKFGSKLLISGILFRIYNNIQAIVIAKFYSAFDLGLFSRANRFQELSSRKISGTIAEITFPFFSTIQNDKIKLKKAVSSSLKTTMYISSTMTLSMLVLSKVMIWGLIGAKWSGSIEFLQLLCIYGFFIPIAPILSNIILAVGRSDISLKTEMIRYILNIPVLVVGALIGIKAMIILMIIAIIIAIIIVMKYVNNLIGYGILDLLKDIKTSLFISITVSLLLLGGLYIVQDYLTNLQSFVLLFFFGGVVFIAISEIFKINEYLYIKQFVLKRFKNT